ncbi:MAG: U32 family peptidase [Pseudobutyrivibrio sp.]|nr:U32 family peptidase [Pseudobutyrivibrio sp.]
MNPLELLSPAGDKEIFKAVIDAGADAVYFGGDMFGARAYAKNFSIEDAIESINYAHLHGAKAYLTVNTLLKNLEIEKDLYLYLRSYVEAGIDAFIVQDFGVFSMIKSYFPDTDIHVSTQVSLCTSYGAKLMEDMGASRIVTAREISLKEIESIHKACPDLEIESFVHGALCVCYSGQCLMSSIIGGRSGNRGRCAQPCRLNYKAYSNGKLLNKNGEYILSPKDFCTIESLPQMIESGVSSFKIEGRMKSLEYARAVVSIYRKYLDSYLYKGKDNYNVSSEDYQSLLDAGNRSGFTDLYLRHHNGPDMITFKASGHTKSDENRIDIKEKKIVVNCKVIAKKGQNLSLVFFDDLDRRGKFVGQLVEAATNKPIDRQDVIKAVTSLGNTPFECKEIIVEMDEDIFLPISALKNARRLGLEEYEKAISTHSPSKKILEYTKMEEAHNHPRHTFDTFVTVQSKEELDTVLKYDFVTSIGVSNSLVGEAIAHKDNRDIYLYMPPVIRENDIKKLKIRDDLSGVIASSMDELAYLNSISYPKEKIILDHRIYTFNNRCISAFEEMGYENFCTPYELSLKEVNHRYNNNSQMVVYSRIPLMVTANCTIKNTIGCQKDNRNYSLIDRKNTEFAVKANCDFCYNVIYNSRPYIAFDLKDEFLKMGLSSFRLDFSIENEKETKEIMEWYKKICIDNISTHIDMDITKGHLKRGVE